MMYTLDTHLQLSASAQASRWSPVGRLDRMHTRPIHMVIQTADTQGQSVAFAFAVIA